MVEGKVMENGTVIGFMAMVNKSGADASIGLFGMRPERLKTHSFFRPTIKTK